MSKNIVIPIVLAAGKSSRSLSSTYPLPKLLIKIKNKAIIEHNIIKLLKYFTTININLFYHKKKYLDFLKKTKFFNSLTMIKERKIMGTAGVLKNLKLRKNNYILVVYGDNLVSIDYSKFINFHLKKKFDMTFAVYSTTDNMHSSYASSEIILKKNNRLKKFREIEPNSSNMKNYFVNAGVILLNSKILSLIPRNKYFDISNDLVNKLLKKNYKIGAYKIKRNGYCLAFDNLKAIKKSKKIISDHNIL